MRAKFKGAYPRPDWTGTATKWTAVMREVVRGVAAKKSTIIFCNFRQEMDRVVAAMERMRVPVFAVRGGMGTDKVGAAVTGAREAAARGPVVVVVQIVSGGAGLNLQFCSRILFLSQHWNPAVVHQAVGRSVRIGQRDVVQVHMFRVVDDVIDNLDRRMVDIHLTKIEKAKEICESLYEGFAPLDAIPSIYTAADHLADAEEEDSDSDSEVSDKDDGDSDAFLNPVDAVSGDVTGDDPQ
jgi:SNF2 family DNA or RNA helicase